MTSDSVGFTVKLEVLARSLSETAGLCTCPVDPDVRWILIYHVLFRNSQDVLFPTSFFSSLWASDFIHLGDALIKPSSNSLFLVIETSSLFTYTYRPFTMVRTSLCLLLASLVALTTAMPTPGTSDAEKQHEPQAYSTTDDFPLPNVAHITAHDPNVIIHKGHYYMFKGGLHVPYYKAASMNGPWESMGTVLSNKSTIHTGARARPWAPTTVYRKGKFYCFYSVSESGSRESAIGVATTDTLDGSYWTDHGALIHTGKGKGSDVFPFTVTNAIDASYIEDQVTGKPYLNYGSFWQNIWQIPLSDDLLSIENPEKPDAVQLTYEKGKGKGSGPEEGSWMSYHDGWYYTWISHGICCEFQDGLPPKGNEYKILVGRSKHLRGPFHDREGKSLLEGGGTLVLGSNHGEVYAPGGLGVVSDAGMPDILYYHYLNTTLGFEFDVCVLHLLFLDGANHLLAESSAGLELFTVQECLARGCCRRREVFQPPG